MIELLAEPLALVMQGACLDLLATIYRRFQGQTPGGIPQRNLFVEGIQRYHFL
jgi:hypothetical protein